MSSGWFDRTEPSLSTSLQGKQGVQGAYATSHYTSIVPVCRVLSHHRTSIPAAVQEIQCVQGGCALVRGGSSTLNLIENLHEPHHHRDSKVCRGLSHEFGVVRPYRTFSMYIVTGETRSAGYLCTSSGWFKHIEPHRTYSNHNITEIARCGEVCHMSSGWFNYKNGHHFTLGKEGRNTYVGTCS